MSLRHLRHELFGRTIDLRIGEFMDDEQVRYSGQADTADECELANDPGADKAAPLHVQAQYDRAADCLLWS